MATPISDALDFFPVNMPAGPEFLAVFAIMAILGIALAKLVQMLVVASSDRTVHAKLHASDHGPYRTTAREPHQRYTIGFLPQSDELLGVGFLKDGPSGITSALLGEAIASGWLAQGPSTTFTVGRLTPNASQAAARLHSALAPEGPRAASDVGMRARLVAHSLEESVREDLARAGLVRSAGTKTRGVFAYLLFMSPVFTIGVLRLVRGVELRRSVGFLAVELIIVALAALRFLSIKDRSDQGTAYLEWLSSVTASLREDVANGRARNPGDLPLAAALLGIGFVPAFAALLAAPDAFGGMSSASSFLASGGSSCSSGSSCGGGGGCGGSSCGGGGGCGG